MSEQQYQKTAEEWLKVLSEDEETTPPRKGFIRLPRIDPNASADVDTSPISVEDMSDNSDFLEACGISLADHAETDVQDVDYQVEDIITENKGTVSINYKNLLNWYYQFHRYVNMNGLFYTHDGAISKDLIKQDMQMVIQEGLNYTGKADVVVDSLYKMFYNKTVIPAFDLNIDHIPMENGELYVTPGDWLFVPTVYEYTPYRLPIAMRLRGYEIPKFQYWLHSLFEEEDIATVQEFLGYCLIPSTRAQEALILVGDGGVGKSGIGVILKSIFGNAFKPHSLQRLAQEKFALADVENKLVVYDDDLGEAALKETGTIKALITADAPITAERKFVNSFEFQPYARIVACANFMLSSLYDDSDGFFRRLHPIKVKAKDPNRKERPDLYRDILSTERDGIFQWMLEGLKRYQQNGCKISWSQRSRKYLRENRVSSNNVEGFFDACCVVGEGEVASTDLKRAYKKWCIINSYDPMSDKRVMSWLMRRADKEGFEYSQNVSMGNKRGRGFKRLSIRDEWKE